MINFILQWRTDSRICCHCASGTSVCRTWSNSRGRNNSRQN